MTSSSRSSTTNHERRSGSDAATSAMGPNEASQLWRKIVEVNSHGGREPAGTRVAATRWCTYCLFGCREDAAMNDAGSDDGHGAA